MGLFTWASPSNLRKPVNSVFNEDVMSLLAFLIIPTVIFPYLFTFSAWTLALFQAVNYLIIAAFVAEYLLKLYVSEARLKFLLDPWHLLDLLIILLALAELLPFVDWTGGRAAPLLRLLRVLRVFTAAGRTIKRPVRRQAPLKLEPQVSSMTVNLYCEGKVTRCRMDDPDCRIPTQAGAWVDLQNVARIDLELISRTLDIPLFVLQSRILQESFPRIDYFRDFTTIFIWDAKLTSDGPDFRDLSIHRHSMLIVCQRNRIVTISTGKSGLFDSIVAEFPGGGEDFTVQVLLAIVEQKIDDGEDIVRAIEHRTSLLEILPIGRTPPSFLEDTFFLKKEAQLVQKNLWHLRQVLDSLRQKKVALDSITDDHLPLFDVHFDEVDYLYETADNINDSLGSLRDLHINTISYEMTRAMRILAVLTCLALIPSTIGGLLGENLVDAPYHVTIPEVALVTGSLMLIALYAFYKMGWLR